MKRTHWQERYRNGQAVIVRRDTRWIPGRVTRAEREPGKAWYVIVAVTDGARVGIYACTRAKDIQPASVTEICPRCLTRPRVGDGHCGAPSCAAEERRIRNAMRAGGIIEDDS
jgi:hypothetical protein